MEADSAPPVLWRPTPEQITQSNIVRFMAEANRRHGTSLTDYDGLHRWSVENRADFWSLLWDFAGIVGDKGAAPDLVDGDEVRGARFFPHGKVN